MFEGQELGGDHSKYGAQPFHGVQVVASETGNALDFTGLIQFQYRGELFLFLRADNLEKEFSCPRACRTGWGAGRP
jgi:hypothetical protein